MSNLSDIIIPKEMEPFFLAVSKEMQSIDFKKFYSIFIKIPEEQQAHYAAVQIAEKLQEMVKEKHGTHFFLGTKQEIISTVVYCGLLITALEKLREAEMRK